MLWGEQMLGWANLKVVDGRLQHELGFAGARPRGRGFHLALDEAADALVSRSLISTSRLATVEWA
jgi:hypothetical protein